MPKSKIIFLSIIIALVISGVSFFIFQKNNSSPQKISIKNTENATEEIQAPEENAPEVIKPDEIVPQKETPTIITESKKDPAPQKTLPVTDYQLPVTKKIVSWGFTSAKNRKIDTIIIHSSYNALGGDKYDVTKLIAEYKEYGVAPHYLIDREGQIYLLVEEKNIAYHAGESKVPDGRTGVNNFSLGIEMINTKEEKYTSEQYAALNSLLKNIKAKYSIKYVLGHDDIAPERKTDPWNFDWKKVN